VMHFRGLAISRSWIASGSSTKREERQATLRRQLKAFARENFAMPLGCIVAAAIR